MLKKIKLIFLDQINKILFLLGFDIIVSNISKFEKELKKFQILCKKKKLNYKAKKNLFNKIKNKKYVDFSRDILPRFIGKIFTYKTNKPFIDIGTVKNFKKSQLINK